MPLDHTKIQIPSGTAMTVRDGIYQVCYYYDGKRRTRSLGVDAEDFSSARKERDLLFAKWRKLGAQNHTKTSAAEKAAKDPDIYIYAQKPFVVKIEGVVIGYASSRTKAKKLRDEHLKIA